MRPLAAIDLFSDPRHQHLATHFRGRDNYSLSDKRRCLKLVAPEGVEFLFTLRGRDLMPGTAEICLAAMAEVHGSHTYIRKALNSVVTITLNGVAIHDGVLHWRSHEETASYWPWFQLPFDAALLRGGENRLAIMNRTSRESLGEFLDPALVKEVGEEEAVRRLATIYVSDVRVVHAAEPERFPRLTGVPASAVAGRPFVVEVSTGDAAVAARVGEVHNAQVAELGSQYEMGQHRGLFEVTPVQAGQNCRVVIEAMGERLAVAVGRVYEPRRETELVALPGMETTYWAQAPAAVRGVFERGTGTGVRISIDDFLADLHMIPFEAWALLVKYLVRRRQHLAMQRLRIPPYTRVSKEDLARLADMAGPWFAGVSVPELINALVHVDEPDLARRVAGYLAIFRKAMEEVRLPGHKVVTFDSAGALCGHYYRAGLDVHVAEIGPACNVLEEACCRGAATAYGKPWGVAAAMHWYFGQGAHYGYDEARVRLARLTMFSSYLAGARQVLWEGGVFDNLPVYNFILSEESWRDYYRRYDDPQPARIRDAFADLVNYDRAQQLPSPRVRFGVVRGINDVFHGTFDSRASKFGDVSMARAWSLLSVFLPHVSFGRHANDHRRRRRRWYSATPYGQVDVIPAESGDEHFAKYHLLVLLGWNTMTEELYAGLLAYARGGGRLFISLPHLCTDTIQTLEWSFFRGGDLSELCGVRAGEIGGRIDEVGFTTERFARRLPLRYEMAPKNPLLVEDYDEIYPVFSYDAAYFGGEMEVCGAQVLARSQRGEPVVLRHRVGSGEVVLLNTWCHPGRGRMLPLAEGILRTMVEESPAPLALDDPAGVVAWFEYPQEDFTRHVFLNTDWTTADRPAQAIATIGSDRVELRLPSAQPVTLASDGRLHLMIESPATQVAAWKRSGHRYDITTIGGDAGITAWGAAGARVCVNGRVVGRDR